MAVLSVEKILFPNERSGYNGHALITRHRGNSLHVIRSKVNSTSYCKEERSARSISMRVVGFGDKWLLFDVIALQSAAN